MAKTGQSEAEVLKPRVAKIPLGRMGTAEEIAAVAAFLSSERASFVDRQRLGGRRRRFGAALGFV